MVSEMKHWPGIDRLVSDLTDMAREGKPKPVIVEAARKALESTLAWQERAFILLAGLHESVEWELAPAIKKEIAELVDTEELKKWH